MPTYLYHCDQNNQSLKVKHGYDDVILTWGDLCELADISIGETPKETAVRKLFTPPFTAVPKVDRDLKEMGMTKLVKRETGVYENVTRSGSEERYMTPDNPNSLPHLHKKIAD